MWWWFSAAAEHPAEFVPTSPTPIATSLYAASIFFKNSFRSFYEASHGVITCNLPRALSMMKAINLSLHGPWESSTATWPIWRRKSNSKVLATVEHLPSVAGLKDYLDNTFPGTRMSFLALPLSQETVHVQRVQRTIKVSTMLQS